MVATYRKQSCLDRWQTTLMDITIICPSSPQAHLQQRQVVSKPDAVRHLQVGGWQQGARFGATVAATVSLQASWLGCFTCLKLSKGGRMGT